MLTNETLLESVTKKDIFSKKKGGIGLQFHWIVKSGHYIQYKSLSIVENSSTPKTLQAPGI